MKVITLLFLIFIVSILVGAVQAQSLESQFQQQGISNPQVSTENGVVTITFDVNIGYMDSEKVLGQIITIMQAVNREYPEKSSATILILFSDGQIMEVIGNPADFRRGMTEEEFLTKADSIRFLTRGPPITPGPCNTEKSMSCQSNPDECPCEPGYKCGPSDTRADEWGCVLEYIPKNAHIVGNKYICNRGYEWGPEGIDCIPTPTGIPTEITPSPSDAFTPPCTGTSNYAYIESRTMENGKEVRIPVMMCNANDLANMDFSVSYDPKVLRFKDAEKGSLNSNFLFESNEISSGNVKISFASSKGVSGSGSIAILTFDVVGSNGDSTTLTGNVNTADTSSGSPISITIKPGKVTVGSTTAGDCDGDGLVTSKDALAALQMSVRKIEEDLCYDVTGDGKVSSDDARDILKKAVKK